MSPRLRVVAFFAPSSGSDAASRSVSGVNGLTPNLNPKRLPWANEKVKNIPFNRDLFQFYIESLYVGFSMTNILKIASRVASAGYFDVTEATKTDDGDYKVRITNDPEDDYGAIEATINVVTYRDKGQTFLESVSIYDISGADDEAAVKNWVAMSEDSIVDKIHDLAHK